MSAEVFPPARVLLDRADDIAALEVAVAQAAAGAGRVLLIEGPPGIGKTALLDELARLAHENGMNVLLARGGEFEREFGFGVVRQLLETRVAEAGNDRAGLLAGAARLAEPVFATVSDPTPGSDIAFATLHGLYWLMVNLAERKPLAVAVDDVQWVDVPSLRFLLHLARRLGGLPILLALTARTSGDKRRADVSALLLEAQEPILRPDPLSEPTVATLVREYLGSAATANLCRACSEATGGNPFLIAETLGELRRDARAGDRIDPASVRRLAPGRIAAAVLLRVGDLDPSAPAFARAVAVLGDQARLLTCCRLAGIAPTTGRVLADALVELAVLAAGEPLQFVHPIIRTVIYEDIPAGERSRLHAGAAHLLADQHTDPRALAAHLIASDPVGDPDVVALLRVAARAALHGGAPDTAVALLRRALLEPPHDDERPGLLFDLGTAEHEVGDPAATEHLREAGETGIDPVFRARAVIGLAWTNHTDPHGQRAQLPLYERAADEVRDLDPELALHLEAARLGALLFNPDLPTRFEDEAQRFRGITPGSAAECLLASFVARSVIAGGGDVAAAADLAERSAAHAAFTGQAGHPLWRTNVTFCLVAAERYDVAEGLLSRALRHAETAGSPQWIARSLWLRGLTRHRRGDLRAAESDLQAAVDVQGLSYPDFRYTVMFPLIGVLTDQGRLDDGEAILVDNGLDRDLANVPMAATSQIARGRLRAARGDLSSARADLDQARQLLSIFRGLVPWDNDARVALIRVLSALGDDTHARSLADETLELAMATRSPRAIGGALHARGLLCSGTERIDLLHRAVEMLDASPSLLWRAEALVDLGTALRHNGQTAQARPILRRGMEIAHRCAATPLADRATGELRATGARPRRRAGTGVAALTASELRVAELAASGSSNKEIAQALFVTLRTVEMHLSNSYSKLEISSRRGLARALQA